MQRMSLMVVLSLCFSTFAITQPKIAISNEVIDLGVIYSGAIKTGRYIVKNIGDQSLRINSVQPSCGCTTAKRPEDWIRPGQTDTIEIQFNSTGFRDKVEKYISIESNDPISKSLTVKLIGEIREELQPTSMSSTLWLGTVPLGKQAEQTMTFKNISDRPISIKNISTSSPTVKVKADQKPIAPGRETTIVVTVTPDKAGYNNEQIVLETDSKNQSKVPLRVTFLGLKPS